MLTYFLMLHLVLQVYACMGSWVQLGNFSGESLATSPLMLAPFQTLVRIAFEVSISRVSFFFNLEVIGGAPKIV